jgi:HK97 family phage prohead protease
MANYFGRHAGDRDAEGFNRGEDGYPTPGRVAWDAWGGDPGERWAGSIIDAESGSASRSYHPVNNLLRATADPGSASIGSGNTLFGHFAVFDQWTEIDSMHEGRFLERIAPGAFAATLEQRADSVRVLYDHGTDPQIGNKPLGVPKVLTEDERGAYYEVDLFDTSYVDDLRPALQAGQLGASFRFRVTGEDWSQPTRATDANPERLEERTITSLDLFEFGPVTFPAYDAATAGLRSRTDDFYAMLNDPMFLVRLTDRLGPKIVEQMIVTAAGDTPATTNPIRSADGNRRSIPNPDGGLLLAAALTQISQRRNP